jgi:curved DNA-binding protein CbpA
MTPAAARGVNSEPARPDGTWGGRGGRDGPARDGPARDTSLSGAPVDCYRLLGVDPAADPATIRHAYRALARRFHPDMPGGTEAAMRQLNAAWAVLRDPAARRAYDLRRAARASAAADRGDAEGSRPAADRADAEGPRPAADRGARAPAAPDVLDFGRYAGWSLRELARQDPNYLLWLARTPIGRRYQSEIGRLLDPTPGQATTVRAAPAGRRWFGRGHAVMTDG